MIIFDIGRASEICPFFLPTFMSLYRLVNSLVMLDSAVVNSANVTRLSIVVQVAGKIQQVSH